MKVTKISAITLRISDMKKSVDFYSKIPNFKIVYGGSDSQFTSFLIDDVAKSYLNLRISDLAKLDILARCITHWSRIIFYTDDDDGLFAYMQEDTTLNKYFESKPQDATWGERFFHMLDPDDYKLSFATPLGDE